MAIKAWWGDFNRQRFWMEATDRPDLGDDLRAPMTGGAGGTVWHYELVSHVEPGDVIFHWHTTLHGVPSLVGWSLAVGPLHEELHPWTAHAGVNSKEAAVPRPNWVMPLGGIHYFDHPLDGSQLAAIRDLIVDLKSTLESTYPNFRYFPFNKYGPDHIRASQAYATKFPRELVELLVTQLGLEFDMDVAGSAELEASEASGTTASNSGAGSTGGGQGYMRDTARKLAIEAYAVDRAIEYYKSIGATKVETLGKPYDLNVELGGEELHVEVKGSTTEASKVLVTVGEVRHAAEFPRVDLVVVDQIRWTVETDGKIIPFGGGMRRWTNWAIDESDLSPVTFVHTLPSGGAHVEPTSN